MSEHVPAVSVLMPVYNGAAYLHAAVDSVLGQTFDDLELLVIDDGSSDGTPAILAEYARNDPRVVVHRTAHCGRVAALNIGWRMARAELIARMDSDDISLPHRLERQVGFLRKNQDLALVGGWMVLVDEGGREFGEGKPPMADADIRKTLERSSPFYHGAVVMRRAALEAVGGYRPAFEPSEDYDLWLRLSERHRMANVGEFVGKYRHYPQQESVVLAEEHGLRAAAARASARDRRAGRPDRFASAAVIDADLARGVGLNEREVTESIVRYAAWLAETSSRAGHSRVAASLWELASTRARSPSGSPELRAEVERRAAATRWRRARRLAALPFRVLARIRARRVAAQRRPGPYKVRTPTARSGSPRVLHLVANFHMGGSAQLVVDLIEGLGDRFAQTVVARDLPRTPAYTNLDLHHHPELTVELADERLGQLEPDLLHVHFLGHHRNAYSERDWQWYDAFFRAAASRWPIIENINIPVEPYLTPAVSQYVFVSDYVRTEFGADAVPGMTIHPGSDLERFSRSNPAVGESDPAVIGMTYRLEGDKLNETSIEPFISVAARRPATKVVIVGAGTLMESYRQRVATAGLSSSVEFTGYVPYRDLPAHMGRMSVFVAPVHRESFGQVSVFAMGLELPVVGFDVGGLPEILGGRDLLVPPGDTEALSGLIIDLLDDERRRRALGRANRDRAVARFSVEAMVGQYGRLYGQLLA